MLTTFISNLVFVAFLVAAVFLVREYAKRNTSGFNNWFRTLNAPVRRTIIKVYNFWANILANVIRAIALIIIFLCQDGPVGIFITLFILIAIPYILFQDERVQIDWKNERTQLLATMMSELLAMFWLIERWGHHFVVALTIIVLTVVTIIYIGKGGENR